MANMSETLHSVTVDDIRGNYQHLGITDYAILIVMLLISSAIGFYFAWRARRSGSGAQDYLNAGNDLGVFPVAMSLIAGDISGISLLATPAEVYLYGMNPLYNAVTIIMALIFAHIFIFPVLFKLKLSTMYEYLFLRYDNKVRWLTSLLFAINQVSRVSMNIFLPSLALNQVTGIDVYIISSIISMICVFYTCIGGIRAVIWTDVLQALVLTGSSLMVLIKGAIDVGGLNAVFDYAAEGDRLTYPEFTFDLTVEWSFPSILLGGTISSITSNFLNQSCFQRFNILPTKKQKNRSVLYYIIGICVIMTMNCGIGLIAYAVFHDCDPLTSNLATNKNQITPTLIMQVVGEYPGLPGLFIAGVLCASLSTLSTGFNSLSLIAHDDFITPLRKKPLSDKASLFILKAAVVGFGFLCLGLVPVIAKSSSTMYVLQMTLQSITTGTVLGLFMSGLLLPSTNSTGAFCGGCAGLVFCSILVLGNQIAKSSGAFYVPYKPLSTENCTYEFPISNSTTEHKSSPEVFYLFKLGFFWYSVIGALITIIISMIVSYFTETEHSRQVNKDYFSPIIRRWLPKTRTQEEGTLLRKMAN